MLFLPHNPRPANTTSAFTLIELIMVLAILTIIAGVVAPKYASAVSRYRLDAAARRVAADIQYAQALARASGSTQIINFLPSNNSYSIPSIQAGTTKGAVYSVRLDKPPYSVTLESASFAGSTDLQFGGFGFPADGGTVRVRAGADYKTLSIDVATGTVKVQ